MSGRREYILLKTKDVRTRLYGGDVPESREKPEKIEVRLNISREGFALNFVSMYFTVLGFFITVMHSFGGLNS